MICSRLVSFVVIAFAVAASAAFPERRIEEHAGMTFEHCCLYAVWYMSLIKYNRHNQSAVKTLCVARVFTAADTMALFTVPARSLSKSMLDVLVKMR